MSSTCFVCKRTNAAVIATLWNRQVVTCDECHANHRGVGEDRLGLSLESQPLVPKLDPAIRRAQKLVREEPIRFSGSKRARPAARPDMQEAVQEAEAALAQFKRALKLLTEPSDEPQPVFDAAIRRAAARAEMQPLAVRGVGHAIRARAEQVPPGSAII